MRPLQLWKSTTISHFSFFPAPCLHCNLDSESILSQLRQPPFTLFSLWGRKHSNNREAFLATPLWLWSIFLQQLACPVSPRVLWRQRYLAGSILALCHLSPISPPSPSKYIYTQGACHAELGGWAVRGDCALVAAVGGGGLLGSDIFSCVQCAYASADIWVTVQVYIRCFCLGDHFNWYWKGKDACCCNDWTPANILT